jgi:CubicO group peptidase (beta-lactamase class C family)
MKTTKPPLPQRLDQLVPKLRRICQNSGVAGASVGVIYYGDVLRAERIGFRDVETRTPPDSQTLYGIGSMTKAMVAAGIGPSCW